MNWGPDFDRQQISVIGVLDSQPISAERVDVWRDYFEKHNSLPPILVTVDGWVVNGRHRLLAARDHKKHIDAVIVERIGSHWVANGNAIKVW